MADVNPFDQTVIEALGQFSWESVGLWFSYGVALTIYIVLIWHFFRFVSKRDIFAKHLSFHHPGVAGFLEDVILGLLRLAKYGALFPLVSFLWFGGFVVLLFFVAQNQTVHQITLISIAIVSAARILSYYKEEAAQELSKTVPIVVLGVALIEPDFFNLTVFASRIDTLPALGTSLLPYIIYLSLLELFLRFSLHLKWSIAGKNKNEKDYFPLSQT